MFIVLWTRTEYCSCTRPWQHAEERPVRRAADGLEPLDHIAHLRDLPQPAVVPVIIIEDAVPVVFRAQDAGSTAEEGQVVRAMRDRLHGPQRQLTGPGRGRLHAV